MTVKLTGGAITLNELTENSLVSVVNHLLSMQDTSHMNRKINITIVALFSIVCSQMVLASSGGGFDQGGFSQKKIDQKYELGKSYFKSGKSNGSRLNYCVKSGEKLKKLSRRSVKQFKKRPTSEFVDSLYSCADPALKIADAVADGQGDAILYYLNKRFKLRLTNG